MRLAYICRNCTLDNGNSRIAWELSLEAARQGHETYLLARRFPHLDNPGVKREKIFQLPKMFGKWRSLSFAWASSRAADSLQAVSHGLGDSFRQDVFTVGNVDWNYGKKIPGRSPSESAVRIKREALRHCAANGGYAVIVSSQLKRDVLDLEPSMPESRIRVIYPGVHLDRFHPSKKADLRRHLSQSFGIPDNAFWISCAAGGDFEKRNLKTLGKALSRLASDPRWVFVFGGAKAGEFPWPQEIAKRSYFLGPLAEFSEMAPACDLFSYPAWFDEFAMVCSEAMASGLPIILSKTVGASEVLPALAKELSVLDNPGDDAALSSKIKSWMDSPDLRLKAGQANREAVGRLAWPLIYKAYEEIYQEVLNRRIGK